MTPLGQRPNYHSDHGSITKELAASIYVRLNAKKYIHVSSDYIRIVCGWRLYGSSRPQLFFSLGEGKAVLRRETKGKAVPLHQFYNLVIILRAGLVVLISVIRPANS